MPYCIVLMMLMFGSSLKYDIIGIIAGHMYYYLEDVVPKLPETEDVKILKAPRFLVQFCEYFQIHDYRLNEEDLAQFAADEVNEEANLQNEEPDILDDM